MNNKMAIYTYLSTTESKNERVEQKQTDGYRGHFAGCHMGGGLGG